MTFNCSIFSMQIILLQMILCFSFLKIRFNSTEKRLMSTPLLDYTLSRITHKYTYHIHSLPFSSQSPLILKTNSTGRYYSPIYSSPSSIKNKKLTWSLNIFKSTKRENFQSISKFIFVNTYIYHVKCTCLQIYCEDNWQTRWVTHKWG